MRGRNYAALMMTALLCARLDAAPMGFKNSWMIMGDLSKPYYDLSANYATTINDAYGFSLSQTQYNRSTSTSRTAEVIYVRKVKRWNMPEAQANVWFAGGVGATKDSKLDETRATASLGVQLDYETTRFYSMVATRTSFAGGMTSTNSTVRLGVSFYEVDYDQAQPWIVIEARRIEVESKQYEFTPLIRVIHNKYFIEAGANLSGHLRFNFMLNY